MLRRLLRLLMWSLGIALAALLAMLTAFVLRFDANDYRVLIEDTVAEALGRSVHIAGQVEIAPALIPTLAVNGVTIANPPWASGADMASAGRLELSIALRPLLDGEIQISSIVLERVELRLERNADQRGNWELDSLTDADAAEQSANRYQTRIDEIELRDITVRYATANGGEFVSQLDGVTLRHLPSRAIEIEGTGRLGALPVAVHWQAGPLDDQNTERGLRWPVTARAQIGATAMALTGRLRAPLAYTDSAFELQIESQNATGWRRLFDRPGNDALAYALSGRVRIDADRVQISELSGAIETGGWSESLGIESGSLLLERGSRIEAALGGRIAGQAFALSSTFGTLAQVLGTAPWPLELALSLNELQLDATGQLTLAASGPRLAAAVAMRGDLLAALNRLGGWQLPELGPLTLDAMLALEPAQASLRQLQLGVAGSTVTGSLEVTGPLTHPRIVADLRAPSFDLAALPAAAPSAVSTPLPDCTLPVAWLERADAEIALQLGALRGLPVPIGALVARATLARAALQLDIREARVAGIDVAGTARIGRIANRASIELGLEAATLDLATILRALDQPDSSGIELATAKASLELQTSGTTLRAAANASTATMLAEQVDFALTRGAQPVRAGLATLQLEVAPGNPTRMQAGGRLAARIAGQDIDEPFELMATGGTLADLIATQRVWPSVNITLNSEHRRAPVAVEGLLGDTAALLESEPAAARFAGTWGPLRAGFDGAIVLHQGLSGSAGSITLATENLAAAAALLDVAGLPQGAAALSGRAALSAQQSSFEGLSVIAPGLEGTGEISLSRSDSAALRGRLDFASLDLTPYLAMGQDPPARAPNAAPDASLRGRLLHSPDPLPLELLRDLELDLEITAELLRIGGFSSRAASLNTALNSTSIEFDGALDDGHLRAQGRLDVEAAEPTVTLRVSGEAVPLSASRSGEPAPGTPVIDFEGALAGRGASPQAIVQSLDGDLLLYLRGGRFGSSGLRFIFGSILYELLNAINPFKDRQDHVDIQCAGGYFRLADGSLSTEKGVVIQTPELQVIGVGNLALASSELTMEFSTKRRTGIMISIGGIVNEFVQLTGTLDAPRIEISPERAARSGLLAFATAGLSLLATDMLNRITSGDVCPQLPALVGAPGAAQ